MRLKHYHETHAELMLNTAREEAIDTAERQAEGRSQWGGYLMSSLRIKGHCFLALCLSFLQWAWACIVATWSSVKAVLLPGSTKSDADQSWDDVYTKVDTVWAAAGGIFDSEAIMTVADRGNVRKIENLCHKIRAMETDPKMNRETFRGLEHWYESVKVHVRKGGKGARRETRSLNEVVDRVMDNPESDPEKLLSWRWEKRQVGMVNLETIRGIRWAQKFPETKSGTLKGRAWKKK